MLTSFRDWLWSYPELLLHLQGGLKQIFYVIFAIGVALLGVVSIQSASPRFQSLLLSFQQAEYREGIIGTVNSLNPLSVSTNSAEEDVKNLLFNRLVHISPTGEVLPDLADTWNITDDGKVYTFFLKDNLVWHDGEPLTADDVLFTYDIIKNREEVGDLGKELAKVQITKIDRLTVRFELPTRNALFMELINIFISPEHLLTNRTYPEILFSEFSQQPVGSGDYQLVRFTGQEITLQYRPGSSSTVPSIQRITFVLYTDENDALWGLKRGEVIAVANLSARGIGTLESYRNITTTGTTLQNRTRLVFLNGQSGSMLQSKGLRQAISSAINRDQIISLVPGAQLAPGPIPANSWAYSAPPINFTYSTENAGKLLDVLGWKFPTDKINPLFRQNKQKELAVSFTYLDTPLNEQVAAIVQQNLQAVGIKLILDPQPFSQLTEQTIPERAFEMLLFEVESNIDPDRYALWHSSNVKFPGLNITGYRNQRVDILLERARTSINRDQRQRDYALFQRYLMEDVPAVFLYHPRYYVAYDHKRVKLPADPSQFVPGARFDKVTQWELL